MGRIRKNIRVGDRDCWTSFDTGARNTYVTEEVAQLLVTQKLPESIPTSLGGKTYHVDKVCLLTAYVEGKFVDAIARVVSEIGEDEDRKALEVLFGALAMQNWGIRLVPDEESLDMTHYPKEFVEF
jgi:hypothetical protein